MVSLVSCSNIVEQAIFAALAAGASSASGAPPAASRTACCCTDLASSSSISMSASVCDTAWKDPMGRPNWTRFLA